MFVHAFGQIRNGLPERDHEQFRREAALKKILQMEGLQQTLLRGAWRADVNQGSRGGRGKHAQSEALMVVLIVLAGMVADFAVAPVAAEEIGRGGIQVEAQPIHRSSKLIHVGEFSLAFSVLQKFHLKSRKKNRRKTEKKTVYFWLKNRFGGGGGVFFSHTCMNRQKRMWKHATL